MKIQISKLHVLDSLIISVIITCSILAGCNKDLLYLPTSIEEELEKMIDSANVLKTLSKNTSTLKIYLMNSGLVWHVS